MSNTEQIIDKVIKGIQDKKGRDITVVDLTTIEDTICKAFVICTAGSPTQVHAVAESVGDVVRVEAHTKPSAVAGLRNAQWVAMDYGDVMVHIFLPDTREFYDLDHLWGDATVTEIANLD